MLSDFLTLEIYFGHEASAQFFEDLAKKYDRQSVLKALKSGDLNAREIALGPDQGKLLCWLSDAARQRLYARTKTC